MTSSSPKPIVAITLGDPGGIGPEIAAKTAAREDIRHICRPLLVGDPILVRDFDRWLNLPVDFHAADSPGEATDGLHVAVYDPPGSPKESFVAGGVGAANGRAAHAWIVAAARLALEGQVAAIATAPISKEAIHAAGINFPGHTELLADLCGGVPVRMMLEGGGLRVVLQTIHEPLARVAGLIETNSIIETISIAANWALRHTGQTPRIAVCGLNPHAGEGGHIGREDLDIIAPAVELARVAGHRVTGPLPADTVYHRALQGDFDMVVAMYHDQGLIPVKTLDFHGGINLTLGLPIIRTSPDHGTAFGIAGRGTANESSMAAAVRRAAELAQPAAPVSDE